MLQHLVPDYFKLKPTENHSDVSDNDMAADVDYKIEQVKMLLERMMAPNQPQLSDIEQLAIVVQLRMILANDTE